MAGARRALARPRGGMGFAGGMREVGGCQAAVIPGGQRLHGA